MLRMPRTLHGELVALADDEGVSLNQLVVGALAGLVARRAAVDEAAGEDAMALWESVALIGRELAELSGNTSDVTGDHDDRLSAVEAALVDLERRLDQIAEDDADARLRDLEDEWYVGRESGFSKGLTTGTLLRDPDQKARRRRLSERIGPRFERASTEP